MNIVTKAESGNPHTSPVTINSGEASLKSNTSKKDEETHTIGDDGWRYNTCENILFDQS